MNNSFKIRFQNSSLRKKIIIMTFLISLLSLLSFMVIGTIFYNNAHQKTFQQQIEENVNAITSQISTVFTDTILCSNHLTLSINQIESKGDIKFFDKYNQISSLLNSSLLIFNGLDSIVYIDVDGNIFSTAYELQKRPMDIMGSVYYEDISLAKNGTTKLFDLKDDCMYRSPDKSVVTMGKKITEIKSGKTLGYLFLNIKSSYLNNISNIGSNHYFIIDSEGNCINPDAGNLYSLAYSVENGKIRYEGDNYSVTSAPISDYNWQVLYAVDLSDYFINVYQFIGILAITSLVILLLLGQLSFYVTARITKPLNQLTVGAGEFAQGNLDIRFNFKADDDIGRLGQAYNKMAEEISLLLKRVDEEATRKRSYELALVQEQVKPHFLYNSLDIIIVLNEMNKTREATRTTRKLADYYRNSLSSSAEFVPLSTEFQIIDDYLDLQSMRYQDKFTYNLSLPDEFCNVFIPKLTLQPLVENALYHGIKEKVEWGNIDVSVTAIGDNVKIEVKDNGLGMSKAMVAKLENDTEKLENHFGVYSVKQRLQLYYHENCSFHIDSTVGVGTTITLIIPKEETQRGYLNA